MFINVATDFISFTHLATTSIGTPNTPELRRDGLRPMAARLEKYSMMRVMVP